MKTVTLIGGLTGVILAVLAYFSELNSWLQPETAMALGFAGYVLIITAVAYFLLSWLYQGARDIEVL